VHTTLRNRIYIGEFEWNGHLYLGKHQPLVSRDLWERVQGVLDGRHAKKNRRVKHDFAFSGLTTCSHCGCSIVGEIKKKRCVYYHCTGYKGRCDEPYVREEVIEQQFGDLLGPTLFMRRRRAEQFVLGWALSAQKHGAGPPV
jgi:site-specific DNA recombinase